jgi:hypothetical protein
MREDGALPANDQFVCAKQDLDLAGRETAQLCPHHKPTDCFENVERWAPWSKTPMAAARWRLSEVHHNVYFKRRFQGV